ncbi:MAG: 50S ribosomal protein L11 methyltransferase [Candidatus Marinimicrobia bacterium]|nr:50S ribosomal protein L11 methyltransferase [Candidatus Neomarinimicrobiota bacterium]
MNPDYIKIQLAKDEETARKLDVLLELGKILSVEVTVDQLTILDLWENREVLLETLKEEFPETEWSESRLEGRDWNREWIEGFQPIRVNRRLWITPPWHVEKIPREHEKIIINPGNAFGTGTHESTYLALKLIKGLLVPGDDILDLGCGSGILSIAAMKLGAKSVHAIDNDPEISNNLQENFERNETNNIIWEIRDILAMDSFDCDLALINIQKHVILPLLKRFSIAKEIPNRVILAGLLNVHRKDIRNALQERGYKILKIRQKKEWIAISAVLRSKNET